jgi:dihydroorotase/N-acyl-D-amino-acid deacylase
LQAAGRNNWHLQEPALLEIEAARRRGVDIEFDIYPYQCGSTVLTQLLPQWTLDGGTGALLDRLTDPEVSRRIVSEMRSGVARIWSDVMISSVNAGNAQREGSALKRAANAAFDEPSTARLPGSSVETSANSALVGQTIEQIAQERNCAPEVCALRLLVEESGSVNIISFNQSEGNLQQLITHPLCSVITDGFYVQGKPHPRLHGTYPELLGRLVREERWLSLADALHKSTGKPAGRLQLNDRGLLKAGYKADITIFDPANVSSHSTYEEPTRNPHGIYAVIKSGKVVLDSTGPLL